MELGPGLQAIGAGLAMVAALGPGIGIGLMVQGAMQGIGRNPDAAGAIQSKDEPKKKKGTNRNKNPSTPRKPPSAIPPILPLKKINYHHHIQTTTCTY